MARNRKNQSVAVRFGPALKAFVLCAIIGGSGVGYVWQKSQINDLGRQIKLREQRFAELDHQNKKLRDQLAMLRSPAQLNERVQRLNLGLGMPLPNQVWRLAEPAAASSVAGGGGVQSGGSSSASGLAMH